MPEPSQALSEREMEILRLVATGATNQQIAQELVISINTVKVHLRNIYDKLGVASRTEATMVAVRLGWVDVPRQGQEDDVAAPLPTHPEMPTLSSPVLAPLALELRPRIPLYKRLSLIAVLLLALVGLAAPALYRSEANTGAASPISAVFPTPSAGSSTARWRTRAQMPTPRTGLAVVAHDGQIYAIGGVSNDGVTGKVERYDPQGDVWTTRTPKPTPVGFVSAAVVGDTIYLFGGVGAEQQVRDVVEVYDPTLDVWETRSAMPKPLAAYGLAAMGDQVYLFGGLDGQGYVSTVYRYDTTADTWQELNPMNVARGFLSAAAIEDRIYVVGGYDDMNEFNTCDIYDPTADSWSPASPMLHRRGGLALVPVRGQLYAIGGGMGSGMTSYLAYNERYEPRVDTWSPIGTPVNKEWQGLGAAFVSPYIYAIGGRSGGNLSVNEAYQALFQSLVPIVPQ